MKFLWILLALQTEQAALAEPRLEVLQGGVLALQSQTLVQISEPPPQARPPQISLSVSNWAPQELRLPSRLQNVSAFTPSGAPSLGLALGFTPWAGRLGEVRLKAGVGFTPLRRTGQTGASLGASEETLNQALYLVPIELGADVTPRALQTRYGSPHVGLSGLPTLLLTELSAHDSGGVQLGAMGSANLGWLTDFRAWWPESILALSLDATARIGVTASGAPLSGFGVGASLLLSLAP